MSIRKRLRGAPSPFHAGLTIAVLRGMPLPDALDFSNALGAMCCLGVGGRAGIPGSVEEVEQFRRRTPHRAIRSRLG